MHCRWITMTRMCGMGKSEELGVKRLQFKLPLGACNQGLYCGAARNWNFKKLHPLCDVSKTSRHHPATHAISHTDIVSSATIRFSPPSSFTPTPQCGFQTSENGAFSTVSSVRCWRSKLTLNVSSENWKTFSHPPFNSFLSCSAQFSQIAWLFKSGLLDGLSVCGNMLRVWAMHSGSVNFLNWVLSISSPLLHGKIEV